MKTLEQISEQEIRELPAGNELDALVAGILKEQIDYTEYVCWSRSSSGVGEMLEWLALNTPQEFGGIVIYNTRTKDARFQVSCSSSHDFIFTRKHLPHVVALAVAIVGKRRLNNENSK